MPLIVTPAQDKTNGVGQTFRKITITLAIFLPFSALLATLVWGYMHGFSSFY
ncbi:hypothetical protein [Prochlorococcus sp. MIT 1223]|uniref:hypothetical protein n=1 Tax=Prochlorococcus sp. MIT 1223 TaxID=3096217 RepID=UPI002A75F337|nr:hypothetical protein [Prochlorococcus sp. MIT 1223]